MKNNFVKNTNLDDQFLNNTFKDSNRQNNFVPMYKSNDSNFANFSIGHGGGIGLTCLWNAATLGVYGDIKCHKGIGCAVAGVFTGGLTNTELFKGAASTVQTASQKEADQWNQIDPTVKFPLPSNPTCKNLGDLIQTLQMESANTDTQSAHQGASAKNAAGNYKAKVGNYINKLQTAYNQNDCAQKALNQTALCQINNEKLAEQAAICGANAAVNSANASTPMSGTTIGFIVGGILFFVVVVIAVTHKSKPTS